MQEMWVPSWSQEEPLDEEMATHSSILAWRIPWTEEPGGLSPRGCKESDRHEGTEHARMHTWAKLSDQGREDRSTHTRGAQIFRGVAKSKQKIMMQCGVATSQGMLAATRSWKTKGTEGALKFLMGAWPCQHLDFGLCLCAKLLQLYPTL